MGPRRSRRAPASARRPGVMPPWYVEKNIGIQKLQERSLAAATWRSRRSRSGPTAARRAATPPTCRRRSVFADDRVWTHRQARPHRQDCPTSPSRRTPRTGGARSRACRSGSPKIATSRHSRSRKCNDVDSTAGGNRATVGGRYVFHHMIWSTRVLDADGGGPTDPFDVNNVSWPVHEVGRNPDFFDPRNGTAAAAGSQRGVGLGAPPLERPRHEGAPRDRLQVPSEGLQAATAAGALAPRQRCRHRHQADGSEPAAARVRRAAGAHEDRRRSSRTCTRPGCGCAWKRSGGSTSRR